MHNVSFTGPAPVGMARPDAMPGPSSNEVRSGPLCTLGEVSNAQRPWAQPSRLYRPPAAARIARDATPAERQFRVAIGLRWAFVLRWTAMSPPADAVVDHLIRCMDAEAMPVPAVLRLWDSAFGGLRPLDAVGAATLATASAVRQMLGDVPGHVRIADERTQGLWIKAGAMAGALWPRQFEGGVGPSGETLELAHQAIVEILCCQSADALTQCADGFKGFARDLLVPRKDGRPHSVDAPTFGRGLDAAARMVRADDNDAYYALLGRQLASVGACDRTFLEIATRRSL